jgi:hypothetical protein
MAETRILMVVKEEEARGAYEEALQKHGVAYDLAESFYEVLKLTVENAYSGLMIDTLTLIRSSKEEKNIAYDCINYYPSIRVKWDSRNKSMNLSPLEQSYSADAETTLTHFIEKRCSPFTARSLRRFNRKETCLSLLLSTSPDFDEENSVKAFTVNISRGGAFIHTMLPLQKDDMVWIRFRELESPEPVQAVVCWRIEWGTCRSIPGIGVMFVDLPEQQLERIVKMGNL